MFSGSRVRFQSTSSSFFSFTSPRSARRRRLMKAKTDFGRQQRHRINEDDAISMTSIISRSDDTRSIRDILWPDPYKDEVSNERTKLSWKQKFSINVDAFSMAVTEYRNSWKGFTTSKGFLVEDEEDQDNGRKDGHYSIQKQTNDVRENVQKNSRFLTEESDRFRNEFRNRTGIQNLDDLRRVARETLLLSTDCVNEFMAGYRKGRDDEVEKMMTEYFQGLEEKANNIESKNRRRKIKRRKIIATSHRTLP
jgi:hypothetical protein